MFTSGRSYEGMNYQIEVICKINMLIVASDGRGWGGDIVSGHTRRCWEIMMSRMITRLFMRKSGEVGCH